MTSKLDIPLHGSAIDIVKKCGPALSGIIHSKFECVATIDGVDFERDSSFAPKRRPTLTPEERFAGRLHSGVNVSVWKGDLTNFSVDAVVNAANSDLNHCGGLAQALATAGGPQFQKESFDYIRKNGKVKTGEAIVTGPGLLTCKFVIHAVGPHLSKSSDVSQAEPQLEKTIRSILDRVKDLKLDSVAIPAISSGIFNYPLPQCADTIVSTVRKYYEKSSSRGHFPKEIRLVNHDEPTVREMKRACRQILDPHLSYSQVAASKTAGAAKTSTPTVQIGKVTLTLKKDNLQDQKTDVIVNTASPSKDLGIGQISGALLRKAGPEMQKEIYKTPAKGYVTITNSYRLGCKEVYHTFCIEKWLKQADQVLYQSVGECLWLAASTNHKSISFPAIGTGALGFSKAESAEIMSDAVFDFALKCQKKMDVYFVIFPTDTDTFKAFEEQMKHLQKKASDPKFKPAYEDRDDFHDARARTSQISLLGVSEASTREAAKWLDRLLYQTSYAEIYNNFIQHFSDKEYQQLSRLNKPGVSIEEFFDKGHAAIHVSGGFKVDVVAAALQVEALLCSIQEEFIKEEEHEMLILTHMRTSEVSFKRKPVDRSSHEFQSRQSPFKAQGLEIVKMDQVENSTLKMLFDLKEMQLNCSTPQTMVQRIPAQFCKMVSHIGFHAEYAPPEDPAYGDGIYFAGTVRKAMETWRYRNEEYLYFVEAEVLTGKSTPGKPGIIMPPAMATDPQAVYDSVSGGPHISVIFSGYQALPRYIITCKKVF